MSATPLSSLPSTPVKSPSSGKSRSRLNSPNPVSGSMLTPKARKRLNFVDITVPPSVQTSKKERAWTAVKTTGSKLGSFFSHLVIEGGKKLEQTVKDTAKSNVESNIVYQGYLASDYFKKLTGSSDITLTTNGWGWFLSKILSKQDDELLITAIILKIAESIAKQLYTDPNAKPTPDEVMGKVFEEFLILLQTGFKEILKKIEKEPIYDWDKQKEDVNLLFEPFFLQIMELIVPEGKDGLNTWFKTEAWNELKALIKPILIDCYRGYPQDNSEECLGTFRKILWDPKKIAAAHPHLKAIPDEPSKDLSKSLGIEDPITYTKNFCEATAIESTELLAQYFTDEAHLKDALETVFKSQASGELPRPLPSSFYKAITTFLRQNSTARIELCSFFSASLENIFLNAASYMVKKVQADTKCPPDILIAECQMAILKAIEPHVPVLYAEVEALKKENISNEEKEKKVKALFLPLAKDLHKTILPELFKRLPISDVLKKELEKLLVEVLLPYFLQKILQEITPWINERDDNLNDIKDITKTTYMGEGLKVVTQWVMNYLPHFLEDSDLFVAKILVDNSFLPPSKEEVNNVIAKSINELGSRKSETMNKTWEGVRTYTDAALIKMTKNLLAVIEDLEKNSEENDMSLVTKLVYEMTQDVSDHFQRINNLATERNLEYVAQLKEQDLLNRFKEDKKLHPALSDDLKRKPEEKDELAKENFYKPFTDKFFKIIDLFKSEQIPFPQMLNDPLWRLTREQLFPVIFQNIFNLISDPLNINLLLLNVLTSFEDSLEKSAKDDNDDDDSNNKDLTQKKINDACGDVIKQLVDLAPNSITRNFFRIQGVKSMAKEKAGKLFRKYLENLELNSIIDKSVFLGLPSFHAGKWKGTTPGNELFDPEQLFGAGGMNPVMQPGEVHFEFPRTALAKIESKKKKELNTENKTRDLEKKLADIIRDGLKRTIEHTCDSKWEEFQKDFEEKVNKNFGLLGLNVKHFFDTICRFILTVLQKIFYYPKKFVEGIIWFFMDMHIQHEAKGVVKSLYLPIHKNLIFTWGDTIMRILQERKEALEASRMPPTEADDSDSESEDVSDSP